MEAIDLDSAGWWESEAPDLRLNPKRPVEAEGLLDFVAGDLGIRGAVLIATSGSSGQAKFVVQTRAALLASAAAVNRHCGLGKEEIWLGGLSTFHVGGIGIHARAFLSGARVVPMAWDAWTRDGTAFMKTLEESGATVTSLTPTHLWDLVQTERWSPRNLRGVFLGGGRIAPDLVERARDLGWPVWPTYGMTEAASQVATSLEGDPLWLPLLAEWETRIGPGGRLQLRGDALFAGYVRREKEGWSFDIARAPDGWFTTGDCVEIRGQRLRFLSRADAVVKVSGELVSLDSLNVRLVEFGICGRIVALPDERREHELVLVCEAHDEERFAACQAALPPVERVARRVIVPRLPRTDLGKPDHGAMEAIAAGGRR
ncbi:MAG: AMP-binding protein [Verrucomicrobiae bacterium]|nr:AMP-binding protein [Verrucomicrobiae bacterium]